MVEDSKEQVTAGYLLFLPSPLTLISLPARSVCCMHGELACSLQWPPVFCCYRQLYYAAWALLTKQFIVCPPSWPIRGSVWPMISLCRVPSLWMTNVLEDPEQQWLCRDAPCAWHRVIHNVCCWPCADHRYVSGKAPLCFWSSHHLYLSHPNKTKNVEHLKSDIARLL